MNRIKALALIDAEHKRATDLHEPMHSLHEGYAVLEEEVDELWDEIKKRPTERDKTRIQAECVQVAAMAMRMMTDLM